MFFFHALELLANLCVAALFVCMTMLFLVLIYMALSRRQNSSSRTTEKQCLPRGCHRWCGQSNHCHKCMKTAFLYVGRLLCVHTFPTLFKIHKTRSGGGRQTREFMVFLDRKVENNLLLILAFCFIALSIFYASAMVFVRYFPVEKSEECLEKDSHGQPLFCYINASFTNPSLPVDCANYTVTELQELEFECYALTFPGGLGIAVAAALGLAKVGIVGISIFIKVSEGILKSAKDKPCANRLYRICSMLLLLLAMLALLISMNILANTSKTTRKLLQQLVAYIVLPLLLCAPLFSIIRKLKDHCDRGEYISFAADQRPIDQSDRDEESESSVTEGEQDEASRQRESGCSINDEAPDDNGETLLIEARGSTKYSTDYGAI